MIRSMEGFTFVSALDLNMGYYHIKLDADANIQKLCTIVFLWHMGKYKHELLPMGIKIAWFLMFLKTSCISPYNMWNTLRQQCYLDDLSTLTNNK
jgi:hypothetical protein